MYKSFDDLEIAASPKIFAKFPHEYIALYYPYVHADGKRYKLSDNDWKEIERVVYNEYL